MRVEEIREGDVVEIDYITEFAKEHINEGKALVIWKGFNNQPLVRKLDTKKVIWTCYEHIAKVVGHIDIEEYMDRALSAEPCDDCISRQAVNEGFKKYDRSSFAYGCVWGYVNKLPSVTPKEKTGWILVSERLPESEGYGHYFLCCLENGIIRILGYSNILTTCCPKGFYYEEENGTTWRQDINPVIAWMPLPAPFDPQESEVSK